MLKQKSKILFCIFLITILISSVCFATDATPTESAELTTTGTSETTGENTTTAETTEQEPEWVNDDMYLFDKDIVIDKVVDGNVFAFGTNVTIKGEVGGELFVFADTLEIDETGYIYCGLYGFAKKVIIKGVAYDVYLASEDFKLENSGIVYRDLRLIASKAELNGKIRRNAHIISNNISFPEGEDAHIGGDLNYFATNELNLTKTAVLGSINYNKVNETTEKAVGEVIVSKIISKIKDLLSLLFSTFIVALLAMFLTPKFFAKVTNMKASKVLLSIPVGLGAIIASVFIIIFIIVLSLFITFTMKVSLAFTVLFFLVCAFATSIASIVISGFITNKFKLQGKVKFILIALASSFVIWLLSLIPFIGWIFGAVFTWLGLGAVVFSFFTKAPTKEINE